MTLTLPQAARWQVATQLPVQYEIVESPELLRPGNFDLLILPDGSLSTKRRLVILDDTVDRLYGDRIRHYFDAAGADHQIMVLPGLEKNKDMASVFRVVTALNELGASRRGDPPIAIGGGVMLDVVGLAACLYRRGIPYIRVPTTLLALVDVGVAAKTGVNYEGFRNRLGSYSPPPRTLIDKTFLQSLPARHLRNGMGEILKMALIKDRALFELLERHGAELVDTRMQQSQVSDQVIRLAIQGMIEELEPNLWETYLKRAVDYGHSFSPLIEMTALPELLHGEAVTLDCVFSAVLSWQRGYITDSELERVVATAEHLGLPVHHPLFTDTDLLLRSLEDTVRHRNGDQNLPVMSRIGAARFINDLTPAEVSKAAATMAEFAGRP